MTNFIIETLFEDGKLNYTKAEELLKFDGAMVKNEANIEQKVFELLMMTDLPEEFIHTHFNKLNIYELLIKEQVTPSIIEYYNEEFAQILIVAAYNDNEIIMESVKKLLTMGLSEDTITNLVWTALSQTKRMHMDYKDSEEGIRRVIVRNLNGNEPKDIFGTIYVGFSEFLKGDIPEGFERVLFDEFAPLHFVRTGKGNPEPITLDWLEAIYYLDKDSDEYLDQLEIIHTEIKQF